jgi:alkanesulfonate monooxygenase SsuD/methylene tetrahydromethanopterin reductase-like flavin-dependent oxidoreductase (luciferase family)
VNPWCLPLQKPHPPIWVPGTASPETALWAGRKGYTYVPFLVPIPIARELFEYYRQGAAEAGREVTPDKLGFLLCAVAADTTEKAHAAGRYFEWRMGPTTRGPVEYFAPPGIRTRAGQRMALRTRPPNMTTMTFEEKVAHDLIVAGTPEYLVERFEHFKRELGIGHLLIQGHESKMDHPTTMRSIELIGQKVIPALATG